MEIVRKILLVLENLHDHGRETRHLIEQHTGESEKTIWNHLRIMDDAGLISHRNRDSVRLTWEGHEFLEVVRDDKRWEKVKAEMSKGGGFVFEVAKEIAVDFFEEEINPNRVQSLKSQLIRRYNNLNELEEQTANYGAVAVPLELKNQIKAEKEAIAELEEKLKILTS